jgi:hemerythrin-like domain-containing protein
MDAIETLMNEHRTIEQVIDALVGFAGEVRRKGSTERDELRGFVTFLREFADAHHHGKEEDILFRTMVEHGFPRNGGPIFVMLHEHDQGRALIAAMAAKLDGDAPWTSADHQDLAQAAAGYAQLLHAHIHKEDAVLYPMAEQHLPPEVLERVAAECEAFEAKQAGAPERLLDSARALVARHADTVHPPADVPTPHRLGCCG